VGRTSGSATHPQPQHISRTMHVLAALRNVRGTPQQHLATLQFNSDASHARPRPQYGRSTLIQHQHNPGKQFHWQAGTQKSQSHSNSMYIVYNSSHQVASTCSTTLSQGEPHGAKLHSGMCMYNMVVAGAYGDPCTPASLQAQKHTCAQCDTTYLEQSGASAERRPSNQPELQRWCQLLPPQCLEYVQEGLPPQQNITVRYVPASDTV
jgi:hypothetical protein